MSESGRKRCRKTKLVPRDCSEFNDDHSFLQEPATKKLLLHKIKTETNTDGDNRDTNLEFSIKVEVEGINDSLPEEDSSDYMKYLFSLSQESQMKSENPTPLRKSTDSWKDADSLADGEPDKEYIIDATKLHKILPILHRKYPNDKEAVVCTRNVWGKVFHEVGICDITLSAKDSELQDVLGEWRAWQLTSRTRESPFSYKCYICTDAWWSYTDFRNHVRIHPNGTLKLEVVHQECNIIVYDGRAPGYKEVFVDGKCFKCAKTFKQHQESKRHSDLYYYCVHCNDKFQTCSGLVKHAGLCNRHPIRTTAVMTDKPPFTEYPCKVCEAVFLSKPAQLEHLSVCHAVRSDEPIATGCKICRLCRKNYYQFYYHVCTKKNIIHPCRHCHALFQNKQMLELHTKVSQWPLKCNKCQNYMSRRCMAAEHYVAHSEEFHVLYRCLLCVKIRLYTSEEATRRHRVKCHKRCDNRRRPWDKIIAPKVILEQCLVTQKPIKKVLINPNPRPKAMLKDYKVKTISKRQNRLQNIVEKNATDEDVDIETVDAENRENEQNANKDTFNIIKQITETIDIKPDILIKEEKVSDDEDVKPDISKLLETTMTTDKIENDTAKEKKADSELHKETNKAFQSSTPIKEINSEFSNVFKVSESILEPITLKAEIKAEPEEIEEDLIILNTSGSIKQESFSSGHSELSLLNLEPEIILQAGYRKRKVYKCNKCDYSGYHREYKQHINSHCMVVADRDERAKNSPELNFRCTKCDTGYPCLKKYALHFVEHGYGAMTCPQCGLAFDSLTRLMPHLNSHIKNQYLRMLQIQDNSEQGRGFQCKSCKEIVDMKNSFMHWEGHLELARESERDENTADARVEARGAYVLEPDTMSRILELLQQHSGENGQPKIKSCFVCHRSFERQNDCKRHLIEHLLDDANAKLAATRHLTCQLCQDRFYKPDAYKKHMRDHASLPIYQCALCNKTFSDSSNYTKHKKVHNLRAFVCDICNKKFQAKISLEKHIELHKVTGPYTCEACDRVFHERSFFNRHLRQHRRPLYKCPVCRAQFDAVREKWDHMWTVHKQRQKRADCPICHKQYRRYTDVKKHFEAEHRDYVIGDHLAFVRSVNSGDPIECVPRHENSAVDSDDDVLVIEEERETLVIYDEDDA